MCALVDKRHGVGHRIVRVPASLGLSSTRSRHGSATVCFTATGIGESCEQDYDAAGDRLDIRRPATAGHITTGMVVPEPSAVDKSTSKRDATSDQFGTMNTSFIGVVPGGCPITEIILAIYCHGF